MSDSVVLTRDEGPCRWILLNRPEKLNAFNAALAASLHAALQEAVADEGCRAIVLTGTGRAFSAGQDLEERREVATKPVDLGASLLSKWHPLLRSIIEADKPVIAAVNGLASGAAANLALACDIVLAANRATFTQPFVRIGLTLDCGGAYTLPRLVGGARARALAMLSPTIDAETAEKLGLIWRAVDDDALEAETRAIVDRLLQAAPLAIASTKRLLRVGDDAPLDASLAREAAEQRQLGASRDYIEGISAFFERRAPRFKGE
jgi:2-(1,2-epoxy-1,2-dihydrophenyl)acetyl-CoA isomerase